MNKTVTVKTAAVCDVCAGIAEGGTADSLCITDNEYNDASAVIDAMFDSIMHVSRSSRTLPFSYVHACPVCKVDTREYATIVGYCY